MAPNSTGSPSLEMRIKSVVRRPVFGVGILVLAWVSGIFLSVFSQGVPAPAVHDEFSYLLAGETYSEGRLSNPTPPISKVFQTFHVLVEPSYMSKYLPGNGLVLALGFLFGHPIFGVWMMVLAGALAAYWMLYPRLGGLWALVGGLYYLVQFGLASYFGFTYWGGSLFALAGILMVGASLRLELRDSHLNSSIFGLGAGIMLITRPMEGAFFGLVITVFLLLRRKLFKIDALSGIFRLFGMGILMLAVAVVFILISNRAVTGEMSKPAYVEYSERYGTINMFSWSGFREINPTLPESFQRQAELNRQIRPSSFSERAATSGVEFLKWFNFLANPLWVLPVLLFAFGGCRSFRPWILAFWVLVIVRFSFPFLFQSSFHFHYSSAWISIVILSGVVGLKEFFSILRQRVGSRWPERLFMTLFFVTLVWQTLFFIEYKWGRVPFDLSQFAAQRMAVEQKLIFGEESFLKRDLVFVEYDEQHSPTFEWVYNGPNIGEEEIIWARDMNDGSSRELAELFPDRIVWKLKAGSLRSPVSLKRWSPTDVED